jgi:hypothetical protein
MLNGMKYWIIQSLHAAAKVEVRTIHVSKRKHNGVVFKVVMFHAVL